MCGRRRQACAACVHAPCRVFIPTSRELLLICSSISQDMLNVTTRTCQPPVLQLSSAVAAGKPFWAACELPPISVQKAKAVFLSQTCTYRENHKDCRHRVSTRRKTDWRTAELWFCPISGNSLLLSVMSDWVVLLAKTAQHWHVTLIRRNIDRKAASKRQRAKMR